MSAVTNYRAKCSCHIGGLYRRAGDEFSLPTLKEVPAHLEVVKPSPADATVADDSKAEDTKAVAAPKSAAKNAKGKTGKATVADDSKVDKTDLGIGEVKSSADVTSADMVHK